MVDKKGKSLKFKVIFFISAPLILLSLIFIIFLLMSADISEKKLGPSPFIVDESVFSDDNEEYKKIIEIGNKIIGESEFDNKFDGYEKDFQSAILRLQEFLKKNEGLIEKVDLEFYKKYKAPKFSSHKQDSDSEALSNIKRLSRLMYNRIIFNTLRNNYEGAKTDLILSNNICDELFKKVRCLLDIMVFTAIKLMEIDNVKVLINQNGITEDQKFEILNIKQELISSQSLKIAFHFEIEYMQYEIKSMCENKNLSAYSIDENYYPFYTPFCYQPNRSAKLMREKTLEIIDLFENPTNASFITLNNGIKTKHNIMERLAGNYKGKLLVDGSESICKIIVQKILSTNNFCNQLALAQKLLAYKRKTGAFPATLTDLKLDPLLYIDIYTGFPFLYSAQNGILQSLGKRQKNESLDLTTKLLSPNEIHDILKKLDYNFVLYLK